MLLEILTESEEARLNFPCSPAKPDGICDKLQGITSAREILADEVDFK
jgi:hypothetical protein